MSVNNTQSIEDQYIESFSNIYFTKNTNKNTTTFNFPNNFILTMSNKDISYVDESETEEDYQSCLFGNNEYSQISEFKNISTSNIAKDEYKIVKVKDNIFMQEIKKLQLLLFYSDENGYSYITEISYLTKRTEKYSIGLKELIKQYTNELLTHSIDKTFGRNISREYTIEQFIELEITSFNEPKTIPESTKLSSLISEKDLTVKNLAIQSKTSKNPLWKYFKYIIIFIFVLYVIYTIYNYKKIIDKINVRIF